MAASIKFMQATANCGNTTLGEIASKRIAEQMLEEELDMMVIHCQEADFVRTQRQLQAVLPEGFRCQFVSQMNTYTKWNAQLGGCGIGTLIVTKPRIGVTTNRPAHIRRSANRFSGEAHNKGGVLCHVTVTKDGHPYEMNLLAAHLGSGEPGKRHTDLANLLAACGRPSVDDFAKLARKIGDVSLLGMDANTRDIVTEEGLESNPWVSGDSTIQSFRQAPLGASMTSAAITYDKRKPGGSPIETKPSRAGHYKYGSLDWLQADRGEATISLAATTIKEEGERDHKVVLGTATEIFQTETLAHSEEAAFFRVKQHIENRLSVSAPTLARYIGSLECNAEAKEFLVEAYRTFLSDTGLFVQATQLSSQHFAWLKEIKESITPAQRAKIIEQSFLSEDCWFYLPGVDDSNAKDALAYCQNKIEIEKLKLHTLKSLRPEYSHRIKLTFDNAIEKLQAIYTSEADSEIKQSQASKIQTYLGEQTSLLKKIVAIESVARTDSEKLAIKRLTDILNNAEHYLENPEKYQKAKQVLAVLTLIYKIKIKCLLPMQQNTAETAIKRILNQIAGDRYTVGEGETTVIDSPTESSPDTLLSDSPLSTATATISGTGTIEPVREEEIVSELTGIDTAWDYIHKEGQDLVTEFQRTRSSTPDPLYFYLHGGSFKPIEEVVNELKEIIAEISAPSESVRPRS